jgi:signal transduction histidine kinase
MAIAVYFDLVVNPSRDFPILYFVPLMIASLRSSARVVRILVAPILLLNVLSLIAEQPRPEIWILSFGSLLLACFLAIRLVDLREEIARLYSAEREARASADERRERMSEFVGVIAHDVRQPLTGAMRFLDLIQMAVMRKDLGKIGSAATMSRLALEQLDGMLEDLTESVRLEMGQPELRSDDVDLGPFLHQLIERLEGSLDVGRVDVIAPGVVTVRTDPRRLERVIGNLLANALKYSDPPSRVTVRVASVASESVISIADQGNGITAADLPHLFERGYRAVWARRRADGLGLGLYITRLLVEALGGRVWVESQVRLGSTFYVALPLLTASDAPSEDIPSRETIAAQPIG